MRTDTRPYWAKKIHLFLRGWYTRHFLLPQFDAVGKCPEVMSPKNVLLFGNHITVGDYPHFIATPDNPIRLTTMGEKGGIAEITIGHYCLISPGVRISSARSVSVGDNCMLAANCYISDSDWHGVYNRTRPFRCTKPVQLKNNVWLGEGAIVCKGVTIGENSVIGAGSIVTKDIPDNVIAAGNPAKVVKTINPKRRMIKREALFFNAEKQFDNLNKLDEMMLKKNTFFGWIRAFLFPTIKD